MAEQLCGLCLQKPEVFLHRHAGLRLERARLLQRQRQVAELFGQPVRLLRGGRPVLLGDRPGNALAEELDALRPAEHVDGDGVDDPLPAVVPGGDEDVPRPRGTISLISSGSSALSKMRSHLAYGSPRCSACSTAADASSMPVVVAAGRPR